MRRDIAVLESLYSLKNLESTYFCSGKEPRGVHSKALLVLVSGDVYGGLSQHLTLAARRLVFREVVWAHKCEQCKAGENHDEYPDKLPFHGLPPDRTS